MSATTSIEWTDKTWNCVRGCSLVSEGCRSCYAMKQAHRFSGEGKAYHGLTRLGPNGPTWTGKVVTVPDALLEPLSWRKPQRVFVNSMSDLFHEGVQTTFIAAVLGVMASARRHTFQVLTKRADRMPQWFANVECEARKQGFGDQIPEFCAFVASRHYGVDLRGEDFPSNAWPLPNVWLGVSCEDQPRADERIPQLLRTPAAVRFISAEPLLGRVELDGFIRKPAGWRWAGGVECRHGYDACPSCDANPARGLDWVIVGGESGPGARPCALEWIDSIVQQCANAGVKCFTKQLGRFVVSEERTAPATFFKKPSQLKPHHFAPSGEVWAWRAGLRDRKGGDPAEWGTAYPRQFPEITRA